jgi:hypothetical protein
MTAKTFEEKFPELKIHYYPLLIKGDYDMAKDRFQQFVVASHVQRSCLSRQRVKEAIEKTKNQNGGLSMFDELLNSLGLDEQEAEE